MPYQIQSSFVCAEIAVEALFEQAMTVCCHKHGMAPGDILRLLEEGDCAIHSSFRYGLAKGLSRHLAQMPCSFCEVYVLGSAVKETANLCSDIDVILVVERKRDEILFLLKRLDLSISSGYRSLLGLKGFPRSLLDIQIMDRREQTERSGVGAVLAGLHTRPICLWRSDPANLGAIREESPQRSLSEVEHESMGNIRSHSKALPPHLAEQMPVTTES